MFAMVILFVFFGSSLSQQSQGGGNRVMSFGKSRARMANEDSKMRVRFADVAGADEEKEELEEIVEFLKEPRSMLSWAQGFPGRASCGTSGNR
jgi:cell division protease FtsH